MKETLAALLFGVAIAMFVACGGSAKNAASPASVGASPEPSVMNPTARDQITELERKIAADLAQMELAPPPVAAALCANPPCPEPQSLSVKPKDDPQCKPGASQTCKDSCTLADSICENAAKICAIAKELASDPWANDKCTSGNASCIAAHDKCCGCS